MKQINIFLIVLILIFVLLPFLLPNRIDESSMYEIDAPIGLVYDEFSDLEEFSRWEEFSKEDSLTIKSFGGGEEEKEFSEWKSSSSSVGNGKVTIDKFEINKSINYKFKYDNWEGEDDLIVDFMPTENGSTKINLRYISQEIPFYYRYFIYFNSPIKKVKASVESFNTLVKVRLEKERKEGKLIYGEFKVVQLPKYALMAMKKFTKIGDDKEVMSKSEDAFDMIYKYLANDEDAYDFDLGFPTIYLTEINKEKDRQTIFAGINLIEDVPLKGGIQKVTIPAGEYLLTLHQGSRHKRESTIKAMHKYAKNKNIVLDARELEVFLNDPKETDTIQLKSRIYIPIKKSE
jgi:effector-binding domain-containing protein/uncharacterized protein YndB with AHSA1/START domain